MRLVIDTDVLVAAMRSPAGASAALLVLLLKKQASMPVSVALILEYEATCMIAEHRLVAGASEQDIKNMLDTIIAVAVPVAIYYQWRPQLTDAGDEMVLEVAVNGQADAIITFNRKDYKNIPARFGIEVLSQVEALRRVRQ